MAIEENITITETGPDGSQKEFEITTARAEDLEGDDKTFAEGAVEAMFDDGSIDQEASFIDYDGDGKLDTAGADTDGDGQLDTAAADTDGDGKIDAVGKDTDGDGSLDVAVFDTDGDGQADAAMADTDGDGQMDVADIDGDGEVDFELESAGGLPTEEEISTNSVEFTVGEDGFPIADSPAEYSQVTEESAGYSETDAVSSSDLGESSSNTVDDDAVALAEEQAHTDAAKEAQAAADDFVAKGDYQAAAEAREVAENEAYRAGDSSMLGAADSSDLENAAWKQETAQEYRAQQQEHLEEGDYVAAKEDAQNAAYATGDADYHAGGADHTGQSDNDVYNLDNAVYQEKNADAAVDNAEWYAERGDFDNAHRNLDQADTYQASADDFASRADQESYNYQDDPTSLVETGGTYGAGTDDTGSAGAHDAGSSYDAGSVSTYDASVAAVDTGIETTAVDTSSASTYDPGDGTV